jgi:hypothetical protein
MQSPQLVDRHLEHRLAANPIDKSFKNVGPVTSASQAAECPPRQPKFSLKTGTLDKSTNKCFCMSSNPRKSNARLYQFAIY